MIKQFEDEKLAQFSYAIVDKNEGKMILIDPARDPQPYLDFADENGVTITGVIETHPHADFVSCHKELLLRLGAVVYTSKLVEAEYPHQSFDEGQQLRLGNLELLPIHTPGHSPDSISILLKKNGKQEAVFTGDTLFIGDCGRPDLREGPGKFHADRQELARQMYYTLREKLMTLDDDVIVYPAHGAGTLCGKSLSKRKKSTIKEEKRSNWSLQSMTEQQFVEKLLSDQPFVPVYFPYDVQLNRTGAPNLRSSVEAVKIISPVDDTEGADNLKPLWVIDSRDDKDFKKGHLKQSINLMEGDKFVTWLGSLIKPGELFYLAGSSEKSIKKLVAQIAAIGYEPFIEAAFVLDYGNQKMDKLDIKSFKNQPQSYTIVDVRNQSEVRKEKIFPGSIEIPLPDLRDRLNEIPTDKPVVVHCAGGYRSAAASSLIQSSLDGHTMVYDLGDKVKDF